MCDKTPIAQLASLNERRKRIPQIKVSPPEHASSRAWNWIPPHPVIEEVEALKKLKAVWIQNQDEHYKASSVEKPVMIIDLTEFEIYRAPGSRRNEFELTSLHLLEVKAKELCFDGILSLGHCIQYVSLVSIVDFSIEGYDDNDDPSTTIFLQSKEANKDPNFDIWYRLGNCKSSYRRFQTSFQWIADFGKHVIDYLGPRREATIGLDQFRQDFHIWLRYQFSNEQPAKRKFLAWLNAFGKTDYRVAIHAYIDYLYAQAYNLPNSETLLSHPFWAQCLRGKGHAIKEQPILCTKTIATPLVYHCFKGMYFGKCLEETVPVPVIKQQQEKRAKELGFPVDSGFSKSYKSNLVSAAQRKLPHHFKVGDVIGIERDKNSRWETEDEIWIAYVQRIEIEGGVQRLFLLWLYRPADTIISTMEYPYKKELFFSDNCNCGPEEQPIYATDVVAIYTVDFKPTNLDTNKHAFIRTKYITRDDSFVTFQDSDRQCNCNRPKGAESFPYRPGDCVYMTKTIRGEKILEPVVLTDWNALAKEATVRRMLRLKRDCSNLISTSNYKQRVVYPNELVWTDELLTLRPGRLTRRCHVRFFSVDKVISNQIAAPYDKGGNGDHWFLTSKLVATNGSQSLEQLTRAPQPLNESLDSSSIPFRGLRSLSIFSGGGNLDRGLEEAGAVRFTGAIDISKEAAHTQLANAKHPPEFQVYWGSVNDYLKALSSGKDIIPIARIGQVQFIAAGSPCPGFSMMQPDIMSENSRRNASLISTLCSYVDLYRPEYAILENVVSMTNRRKGHEEEKVFSQLIACLVALGYQVNHFLMDSWNYGSCQQRSRVFVTIAAPGFEPILQPFHTHNHPPNVNNRSLGKLANGEPFGSREFPATPFNPVTAGDSTADLPNIESGTIQACIPFPDHRVIDVMNENDRGLMKRIPVYPAGQGQKEAINLGLVPPSLMKKKKETGNVFRRVIKQRQFPTITTKVTPQDARCGQILHSEQPRPLSLMEARRAQGIRDYEVIIGSLAEQWRIVGNGVDRNVAYALGLALRQAWEATSRRLDHRLPLIHEQDYEIVDVSSGDESASNDPDGVRLQDNINVNWTPSVNLAPKISEQASHEDRVMSRATTSDQNGLAKFITESATSLLGSSLPGVSLLAPLAVRVRKRLRGEEEEIATTSSSGDNSRKRTRHSGLQAEYKPKRWDKPPERAFKKSDRR